MNSDPHAQVSAKHVLRTVAVCEGKGVNPVPLLHKYNLCTLHRNEWCSLQTNLNLLQDIHEDSAAPNLIEVGRSMAELLRFPQEVDTIHKAFMSLNRVYQQTHQGEVGLYQVLALLPQHIKITAETPYPYDFQLGLCWGIAQRFLPRGAIIDIQHHSPPHAHHQQNPSIYEVTWQLPCFTSTAVSHTALLHAPDTPQQPF